MKVICRDKFKTSAGLSWPIGFALEILKEEYTDFETTVLIEENETVMGLQARRGDKDNLISGNPEKSYNAEWDNPELSTIARQRTQVLKKQDVPEDYKKFISCMIDIAHEIGHIKKHTVDGKHTVDTKRYKTDLEYRINIETEAEEETTRIAKKYGFYHLINEINLK